MKNIIYPWWVPLISAAPLFRSPTAGRSRYMPHQSKRERARRKCQLKRGIIR